MKLKLLLNIKLIYTFLLLTQTVELEAQQPELVVQTGHPDAVYSVAFSTDGKTLASGSSDNTIKLWEVATGRELRTLSGHSSSVNSVAFNADGQTLASGSFDKTIKLWEVATGRELRTLSGHSFSVDSVSFSADGQTLATGSGDKTIKLWEVATGKELRTLTGHSNAVNSVNFSADGQTLASGSFDFTIKLWEVATGRELRTLSGHSYFVSSVAFSADGKTLASGGWDKTIKLWEVATGRELRTLSGHSDKVDSVAFSADGQTLATGSGDKTIKLWEVTTGRESRTLSGHSKWVSSVEFSADGKTLASGSWDNTIKLWEVATGRELHTLSAHVSSVYSVAFSADGKTLASGNYDSTIKLWEVATGRELPTLSRHPNVVHSVAFSADGQTLASGSWDKTIKLWEVATGRELRTLSGHSKKVFSVAFSADRKTLASGSWDNTIKLWEVATGRELRTLSGHSYSISSVAFSADGRTLASGSWDRTIKLWEVATGRELRTLSGHSDAVISVAFSADGKTLASGSGDNPIQGDDTIKLWEVATGRELHTLSGHSSVVNSVAFSADGKTLASGSLDKTIKLWEVATGRELHTLKGHSSRVSSVAFSADGRFLFSGSDDATIRLWRVETGEPLARLIALDETDWAVVMPDGRFDTNDLEEIKGLHWIMPDDSMKPLPLEIFMRDYYEPRLLARILNGEKFKDVRSISEINRVQPGVEIKSIAEQKDNPELVTVTVEVGKATGEFKQGQRKITRETGVYDVRLFRDGQIVGQWPEPEAVTKDVAGSGNVSDAAALGQWRQSTRVKLDTGGKQTVKFENIRLPRRADLKEIEFSAYAFNEDRVKSQTDRERFQLPRGLVPAKGRAYLISVGVNTFENRDWNLLYAANDARLTQKLLFDKLTQTGQYEVVIQVPLISDAEAKENRATKANFKAVLDLLSGRKTSPEQIKAIPNSTKIKEARPEDLVLISFSSHGYSDDNGNFYLFPADIGKENTRRITELKQRLISSEDLSLWLKDVDAGEMVMIVDACHSAAAVGGNEFKPGPMGSRGLGQLSYDKGMRILTATQADNVAIESGGAINHGLLSYALLKEGLELAAADFRPKDKKIQLREWLEYGEARVPKLYEELATGRLKMSGRDAIEIEVEGQKKEKLTLQRPSLFDFRKGRDDRVWF